MSKVLSQETQFTDIHLIRLALEQQGFTPVFQEGYPSMEMQGYKNQVFQANLGVTRANWQLVTTQFTYGDLGFTRKADGTVGFTGDDILMRSKSFEQSFDALKVLYTEKKYVQDMYESGYTVDSRMVNEHTGAVELEFARAW